MASTAFSEEHPPQRHRLRPTFSWLTDRWMALLFIIPTLAVLLFVAIYPLVWSLQASFTDRTLFTNDENPAMWIGTDNYVDMLTTDRNPSRHHPWQSFIRTGRIVAPAVLIQTALGLGIAMLLHRKFAGRGVIMTLLLIPMMLSPVVVALFWRFMLNADSGVVNYFISDILGINRINWLERQEVVPWAVVLVDVWMWTPFMMLISLAGLTAVPKYLYEAADVDRAGAWFRFRHITLPMVAPLLLIGVIFRIMDAYKMIDIIFVLVGDNGGAGRAAQTAGLYVYETAFADFGTGSGAAYGYIMLVVIIALANLLIRQLNKAKGEQ